MPIKEKYWRDPDTARRQTREWGKTKPPEYWVWNTMKQRCSNSKAKGFSHYGGRGIRVCARWRNSFAAFFADMGARPSAKHSLDRYPNVNGDYSQDNCRWATRAQQIETKRDIRFLDFRGRRQSMKAWAREVGVAYGTVRDRIRRGLPIEQVLSP